MIHPCDRRTDRRTGDSALSMLSRAKNWGYYLKVSWLASPTRPLISGGQGVGMCSCQ